MKQRESRDLLQEEWEQCREALELLCGQWSATPEQIYALLDEREAFSEEEWEQIEATALAASEKDDHPHTFEIWQKNALAVSIGGGQSSPGLDPSSER